MFDLLSQFSAEKHVHYSSSPETNATQFSGFQKLCWCLCVANETKLILNGLTRLTYAHTYCRAPGFSFNGVHCCHDKHKPEKKCEEEDRIKEHPI